MRSIIVCFISLLTKTCLIKVYTGWDQLFVNRRSYWVHRHESLMEKHNWFWNHAVLSRLLGDQVLVCFLSLSAKACLNCTLFEKSCSWPPALKTLLCPQSWKPKTSLSGFLAWNQSLSPSYLFCKAGFSCTLFAISCSWLSALDHEGNNQSHEKNSFLEDLLHRIRTSVYVMVPDKAIYIYMQYLFKKNHLQPR